mgnify:CR=1 FL=1
MLERLRMQEVSEIVLTVPEGAIIAGTNLTVGEPIMIIKDPSLSVLEFKTTAQTNTDAKGFLSASGLTSKLSKAIFMARRDASKIFITRESCSTSFL